MNNQNRLLPFSQKTLENVAQQFGTPVWVTDENTIIDRCNQMIDAFSDINIKIFYAMKANYNPHYIKIIKDAGIYGIDAVSPNEVKMALSLGYKPEQIIFTPSNPTDAEMQEVGEKNILQNLGSLSELERFGKMFSGQNVSVRLSPNIGVGEFDKITTGQNESKFGIVLDDFEEVQNICEKYELTLVGIHCHLGSGFYSAKEFTEAFDLLFDLSQKFENIKFIDMGGGFGVQYHPEKEEINLQDFADALSEKIGDSDIEIRIEPGKFLISQSTVLLMKATTRKSKAKTFIGTDSGFHHLIRPAMYGAYQHILNISKLDSEENIENVQIAGNVCETCDIFNENINMPKVEEDDLLAILVAGGYGSTMSSNYNLREQAVEVLVTKNGKIKLTKKRQSYEQMVENFVEI